MFRVAIAYGVVAWVLAQVADLAFENFGAPDWVSKSVLFVLVLGFPLAVLFAWAFELTPDGIKKEKDVDRDESITAHTGRKLNYLIIGVLAVAVAFLLFERTWTGGETPADDIAAADPSRLSIAVLPFDNRSNMPDDEFFTEGIHDDLLTTMANIGSMKVISRTSVMEYRDTTKKIPEIARELGVQNILEGGVQRSGNQVRINVQLIDAATDEHLWAEIYDRELNAENLFRIQSEVARAIADALQATLSPDEARRVNAVPTANLQAYETYLLGRQRWTTRTAQSTAESVELFLKAIELDPEFAEAWAGLGDAYRHQVDYGGLSLAEQSPKAERAIRRALELNGELAEAHAAMGGLLGQQGRQEESLEHLEYALELNPSYSPAYNWIGNAYTHLGRFDEAIATFQRGLEIDPLSAVMRSNLARHYLITGRYEDARNSLERMLETHPESPFAYHGMAWYYSMARGRIDSAQAWARRAVLADPADIGFRTHVARDFLDLGDTESAARWIESARELQPMNTDVSVAEMLLELRLGRLDSATRIAENSLSRNEEFRGTPDPAHLAVLSRRDREAGVPGDALDRYRKLLPDMFGPGRRELNMLTAWYGPDIIQLYRESGDEDKADELLAELLGVLKRPDSVALTHSFPLLPAAYALAGRRDDALQALRELVEAGWRIGWWYYLDHDDSLAALRDLPEFESLRIKVADDMRRQLENVRRLEGSDEMPTVPGMEPLSDNDGAPPI